MPCVWNLKPEDRHCLFCTAENCDERNQRVPPCGKCTHLLETKISDVCSTLECDHFPDIAEGSVFPVWVRVERIKERV